MLGLTIKFETALIFLLKIHLTAFPFMPLLAAAGKVQISRLPCELRGEGRHRIPRHFKKAIQISVDILLDIKTIARTLRACVLVPLFLALEKTHGIKDHGIYYRAN